MSGVDVTSQTDSTDTEYSTLYMYPLRRYISTRKVHTHVVVVLIPIRTYRYRYSCWRIAFGWTCVSGPVVGQLVYPEELSLRILLEILLCFTIATISHLRCCTISYRSNLILISYQLTEVLSVVEAGSNPHHHGNTWAEPIWTESSGQPLKRSHIEWSSVVFYFQLVHQHTEIQNEQVWVIRQVWLISPYFRRITHFRSRLLWTETTSGQVDDTIFWTGQSG